MGIESGVYARDALIDFYQHDTRDGSVSEDLLMHLLWLGYVLEGIDPAEQNRDEISEETRNYIFSLLQRLDMLSVFVVSEEICSAIDSAARVMSSEPLRRDDLLVENGFIYFERPFPSNHDGPPVQAIAWIPTNIAHPHLPKEVIEKETHTKGITVLEFTRETEYSHVQSANIAISDIWPWRFDVAWTEDAEQQENTMYQDRLHPTWGLPRKRLHSLLRFAKQRLCIVEELPAPRHVRRLTARRGKEIDTLKVITLRKIERRRSHSDGDHEPVDWSHRWGVEGHWRNQWYPSKERHEQIYIHPYIKGPEDKPLVLKETIFKVAR